MARRTLIAGNWKMNLTVAEAQPLVAALKARTAAMAGVDVAVCPPFTSLAAVVAATAGTPIQVGAQNVHWEQAGAFTGEVSAAMLREVGVTCVIIGHSERRQYFGETDATVNARLRAALGSGLMPIVCIGETLRQRDAGETEAVVRGQVAEGLAGLTPEQLGRSVIAYEPVWAIGTGRTATPEQAQEVHRFLRGLLRDAFGGVAEEVRILYGGSMKPGNAASLLAQADIDGGLIGGASLKAEDFLGIIAGA
ncbi:MAG: triose-phosphate isomerase [Lentisphaeria bacterium]|nr:triose-phosphate isomerase [Lentisphaeria bacterium]